MRHEEYVPSGRVVPGEGPLPCRVMLIGEGPSGEEDHWRRPFVGPSGKVMDQLLMNNGIQREEVYITNIVKHWAGYKVKVTQEDVERDEPMIAQEWVKCQPEYVGLIGATAVRWFFGTEDDVKLEWAHGLPFHRNGVIAMPMYHPANVFNSPDTSPMLVSDFQQFAAMIKGRLTAEELVDQFGDKVNYRELKTDIEVATVFTQAMGLKIYVDTEGWYWNPWGLSFTFRPGQGYVIHRTSKSAMRTFIKLVQAGFTVVMHNSMHDIEVLEALGLKAGTYPFIDTMVRAYHLCVEPQGLKPLSRRHCGAVQMEYEEVTAAAEFEKAMTYLYEVEAWASKQFSSESEKSSKTLSRAKRAKAAKMSIPVSDGIKLQMMMKFRD